MKLYLDDIRNPPNSDYVVARSSEEAIIICKAQGMPDFMSLDHDLGGEDTTMVFLHRLVQEVWNGTDDPPQYQIHSANPVGSKNIESFMNSWVKSMTI
jgi:hypothetical protein